MVGKWNLRRQDFSRRSQTQRASLAESNSLAREIGPSSAWARRHPCRPIRAAATRRQGCRRSQGFAIWLACLKAWKDLQIGDPPNQFYVWALQGIVIQTYFAAPQPDASNQVSKVTDLVLQKGADFFATNDLAEFQRSKTFHGLEWKG